MEVKLLAITNYKNDNNPEALLERAGRLCYASTMGNTDKFLRSRIEEGHMSLVEHASASFYVGDISRTCSHQLVRHRLCSFSQRSQRYVSEDNARFVTPPSITQSDEALKIYNEGLAKAQETYDALRQLGIPKEDSRFILPNAAITELIMSFNFREALHMFRLRICPQAQWEIREVCIRMLTYLSTEAPAVFEDLYDDLGSQYPKFFAPEQKSDT